MELMHEGQRVVLAVPQAVLGRVASCEVQVTHPLVSRRHCRVEATADGIFVEDLGSSNGTYVNGGRVAGRVRMCEGDVLRIGQEGPEFRLVTGHFDGRDVGRLDAEAMEKTMLAGDPHVADMAAQVRVAPAAVPVSPHADDEPPTRAAAPDDAAHTLDVVPAETTGSIPVAIPMEPSDESLLLHGGARGVHDPEPPTQEAAAPHAARQEGRPTPTLVSPPRQVEEPPTTEAIELPRATGFVPGVLVGVLVGLLLAAAAAVFTPWGDTLPGWPESAPADVEDGR